MEVVFNAINLVEMALFVFENTRDVFEKIPSLLSSQNRSAAFSTEYDLIQDLGVGAHGFVNLHPDLFLCLSQNRT